MADAGSDILTEESPKISLSYARDLLTEYFPDAAGARLDELSELPSERDRNVMWRGADGRAAVLKVSSSAEDLAVVRMENAAMAHVAAVDPLLPVPRLLPARDGEPTTTVLGEDGREHLARLVTVVPGEQLEGRPISLALARDIGRSSARMSVALRGFFHPAGARTLQWDLRRVGALADHATHIGDPSRRAVVTALLPRVQPAIEATIRLRSAIQHGDVTLTNVLADDTIDPDVVSGLIDFGDIHHTAVVCDLVASLNSVLRSGAGSSTGDLMRLAAAFVEGYQRVQPLDVDEAELLGDLVLARLATTVLISAWRSGQHPDNVTYITQYDEASWTLLHQLTELAPADLTAAFTRLVGTSRARPRTGDDSNELADRRAAVLGGRLAPLTYRDPLEIVRGDGPWLYDAAGRRYLDGYNNVPVVGHAHPTVVQAISRQAAVLNVNSRYLHPNIVDLAERITASMPDHLDTCIFANSGTEANDLAWRIAVASTGGTGAMIVEWAYHGISTAIVDFSSNEWPAGHHPEHVATFRAPHTDLDCPSPGRADGHQRVTDAAGALVRRGHRPALLLVDSMFTSEGILDASPDFMDGLVAATHEAGALVLADEVQAGFGRTGPAFWRFAALGMTPDIVTLGKPMGSGHPVAAVVTTRAIAEQFAQRYEFFSTFAGNPVSCAAALAVMDVLEQEQIPAQASVVGDHLRARLRELAAAYSPIAAVRGTGLVAGVQLAGLGELDGRQLAARVVEELRGRGCLVGATGPGGNVLKIRPPLVWREVHADLLADTLAEVLADLTKEH